MAVFEYKGYDSKGREVKGLKDFDSEGQLKNSLQNEGIFITSIKEISSAKTKGGAKKSFFEKKITIDELAITTKQLAVLSKSGISLVESLTAIIEQTESEVLKRVLSQVKQDVNEGISFADALKKHPKIFNNLYVSMIQAGQSSGTLDLVLDRLSEFTENQSKLRKKVSSALTYPIVMVVFSFLVISVLFIVVIPKISKLFLKMKVALPPLTSALISISKFMSSYWYIVLAIIFLSIYIFRRYINTPKGRKKFDNFKLNMPIFGPIIQMVAIARFSKTLATLLKNGVPLLTSFQIVKNVVDNHILKEAIEEASNSIREGESIAKPLKKSNLFPPIVTHMIAIGERSGQLEHMLENVATTYESQVENKLSSLTSLLEPFIIIFLGGVILLVVLAIMMPIMKMNQLAKGR
ncbi:type II secretion system inner membrane protein GspF [bacterium]|nr:type II secretion system inner membrane protein GspF [bacterium]